MLRSLYIRDYALIEELEVEFNAGLNIITGETGAGKSILIGALKMILGERASTEVVRTGAKKAVIEGVFDQAPSAELKAVLEENDIEVLPTIVLRREISSAASRGFINDTPATAQLLREVAANLIDLHGQHEHQSLLHVDRHLPMLDNFGGLGGMKSAYRKQYDVVEGLIRERKKLTQRERELRQQKELYEFQIGEIDRANPQQHEEEELEAERSVLENAEHLFEATAGLYQTLYESEAAVNDHLVRARNELQDLARIDKSFEEQFAEMQSAQIVVAEVSKFLQDYNARIEFNPERLEEIRGRLGELELLKRKYGGSLEAVIAHRKEIGATYDLAADFEGNIARLAEQIEAAQRVLSEMAQRLSSARREVAAKIEKAIVEELARLGMPHARFEVHFALEPHTEGWVTAKAEGEEPRRYQAFPSGMDVVEFYISANLGETPKPLARVASGGEISRIMLSLKTVLARSERLPILVFDEIDVGISGVVARKVGESMYDLGRFHQIIAITHLAQIAALGNAHFVVEKYIEENRTKTHIRKLEDADRAAQVARLISGAEVTDAALESARQLMVKREE